MNKKLFRNEALEAKKMKWMGDVVLASPISFVIITIIIVIFTTTIILFFSFGSYTKRTTVQGQIMPDTGLIRVYSPDGGIISKKFVKDGQTVEKNAPLFEVKMSRYSAGGNYSDSMQQQIELKRQTLDTEKNKLSSLHENTYSQTVSEINSLNKEINQMNLLISDQHKRLQLAQDNLNRYSELRAKDYISVEEYQSKQDIYYNLQLSLKNFERERIAKQAELDNKQALLKSSKIELDNSLNNIDRQIASSKQEGIENTLKNSQIIRASTAGKVTSVNVAVGQQVLPNVPLLNIIPTQSKLNAHLYVPSSAIGFIRVNQPVKLRMQAFPYQKFGQTEGSITSISDTTIKVQDLLQVGELNTRLKLEETDSVYLVKVKINNQYIKAYGERKPLKVGMVFDADVMQEKRKLYEWVLEPLYSITGKL